MGELARSETPGLSIAAVERDTGLSKDTLRVWERRYGFPTPERDAGGERFYPPQQVHKLRLVKRLMDAGHRPGRIVVLATDALQRLCEQEVDPPATAAGPDNDTLQAHLALIRAHDLPGLHNALTHCMSRHGVAHFVMALVAPLNIAVGEAWMRGQMEVFEEHLYTEAVQRVLRQAIARIPDPGAGARPRVLLSTLPGEPHGLGLLMAEAVLALEGCCCISLGVQTPVWDIVRAASACQADIVALGYTGCASPNQGVENLRELRAKLPPQRSLWVGGSAPVLHRRRVEGVLSLATLAEIAPAVRHWRETLAAQR